MRAGKPSQTASFVALVRALADDGLLGMPGFRDPPVARLLSPGWRLARRAMAAMLGRARAEERAQAAARMLTIPLRVVAIDREVERAVAAGARQLVVLGAGLDTRALRMRALAGVDVYEVDHPDTQAYKRRAANGVPRVARSLTFVGVDFERDDVGRRLAEAGHHAGLPTVWIWEGVVMYLTDDALRSTLAAVARASAAGSTLLVHYPAPRAGRPRDRDAIWQQVMLRAWGEPQVGLRTPEAMHAALARAGFHVERDTRPAAWAA
ncbi:MAG TPA: class I SAM-dependent methyltransferase, partial [Kofleriaceae bacterium]|nr:class I SAM-dependent methyltransferase [Kofleriaceae bacterium]